MPPLDSAAVVAAVRDYVARAIAPLQAKLDALPAADDVQRMAEAAAAGWFGTIARPKDGEPGKDGKDADPAAIAAAVESMEGRVLASVRDYVAKDVTDAVAHILPIEGKPGEPGAPGKDGEPGPPGTSVDIEDLRPLVVEEISNTIALVPKAKDGAPGRDAAQIEVAAAIDEAKSYPRGTYAKHANGLWRAYETTEGMRGWECLVAGVAGIEVLCNHQREFQVVHTLSDGKQFAQTFELPLLIYRGVFSEGREYRRGDQVSWGNHQWHCNEPTMEKPDTAGKAWTLSVKRGRDGKQGDPGKDGKTIVVKEKA